MSIILFTFAPSENERLTIKRYTIMSTAFKIYVAVIEITKMYKDGYSIDSVLLQKECESRKEAKAFINRVGTGKKGLYSVDSAKIYVEN